MIPLYAKLIMTFALDVIAISLFVLFRGEWRKRCMIAMLLSTCGDLFMVDDFIPLGDFGTYVGAAFFIVAHIVYAGCFTKMSKVNGYKLFNIGFFSGCGFMVGTTIVLAVFAFRVPNPATIMFCLLLIYIAVIGYHLVCNFSYCVSSGGVSYILAFAVVLFYVSDLFIFVQMLNVSDALRDYVWILYPIAQLLLIVFNSPLKTPLSLSDVNRLN